MILKEKICTNERVRKEREKHAGKICSDLGEGSSEGKGEVHISRKQLTLIFAHFLLAHIGQSIPNWYVLLSQTDIISCYK